MATGRSHIDRPVINIIGAWPVRELAGRADCDAVHVIGARYDEPKVTALFGCPNAANVRDDTCEHIYTASLIRAFVDFETVFAKTARIGKLPAAMRV